MIIKKLRLDGIELEESTTRLVNEALLPLKEKDGFNGVQAETKGTPREKRINEETTS